MDWKVETRAVVKLETLETDDELTAGLFGFLAHLCTVTVAVSVNSGRVSYILLTDCVK